MADDRVLEKIQPQVEDAEKQLWCSPSPSIELAFSSSLSQILTGWSLLDEERFLRFVVRFPRTCCVTALRQEAQHGAPVFQALCKDGGVISCRDILCICCSEPHTGIRDDALGSLMGECSACELSSSSSSSAQESCQLVLRSMVCALTRKLSFQDGTSGSNDKILAIFHVAMEVAAKRVQEQGSSVGVPLILEPVYKCVIMEYLHCVFKSVDGRGEEIPSKTPRSRLLERYFQQGSGHGFVSFEDIATLSNTMETIVQIINSTPPSAQNHGWNDGSLWVLSKQQKQDALPTNIKAKEQKRSPKLPWWVQLLHPRLSPMKRQHAGAVSLADVICPHEVHVILTRVTVATASEAGLIPNWKQCCSHSDIKGGAHAAGQGEVRNAVNDEEEETRERGACARMCLLLSLFDSVRSVLELESGHFRRRYVPGNEQMIDDVPEYHRRSSVAGPRGAGAWLLSELRSRVQVTRVLAVWDDVVCDAGRQSGSLDKMVWWVGMQCFMRAGSMRVSRGDRAMEVAIEEESVAERRRAEDEWEEGKLGGWEGAVWIGEWDGMGALGLVKETALVRAREEVRRVTKYKEGGLPPDATDKEARRAEPTSEWDWLQRMGGVVLDLMIESRGQYRHCLQAYVVELGRASEKMKSFAWLSDVDGAREKMAVAIAQCPMYLGALVGATSENAREALVQAVLRHVGQSVDCAFEERSGRRAKQPVAPGASVYDEDEEIVFLGRADDVGMGDTAGEGGVGIAATRGGDVQAEKTSWYARMGSGGYYSWVEAMVRGREASRMRLGAAGLGSDAVRESQSPSKGEHMEGLKESWWCALLVREEQGLDRMFSLSPPPPPLFPPPTQQADPGESDFPSPSDDQTERCVYLLDAIKSWRALLKEEVVNLADRPVGKVRSPEPDGGAKPRFQDRFALLVGACDMLVLRRARLAKVFPQLVPAIDALANSVQACTSQLCVSLQRDSEWTRERGRERESEIGVGSLVPVNPLSHTHQTSGASTSLAGSAKRDRGETEYASGPEKRRRIEATSPVTRTGILDQRGRDGFGGVRGERTSPGLVRYLMAGARSSAELLESLGGGGKNADGRRSGLLCKVLGGSSSGAKESVLRYLNDENPNAAPWASAGVFQKLIGGAKQKEDDAGGSFLGKRRRARELIDVMKRAEAAGGLSEVIASLSNASLSLQDAKNVVTALAEGKEACWDGGDGSALIERLVQAECSEKDGLPRLWLAVLRVFYGGNGGIQKPREARGSAGRTGVHGGHENAEAEAEKGWKIWGRGMRLVLRVLAKATEEGATRLLQRLVLGVKAGRWQLGTDRERFIALLLTGADWTGGAEIVLSTDGGFSSTQRALAEWLAAFPYTAMPIALSTECSTTLGNERRGDEHGPHSPSARPSRSGEIAPWVGPGQGIREWWTAGEAGERGCGGWQTLRKVLQMLEAHGLWTSSLKQDILDVVLPPDGHGPSHLLLQGENLEAMACHDSRGFLDELRKRVAAIAPGKEAQMEVCRWTGGKRGIHLRTAGELVSELEAGAWVRAVEEGAVGRSGQRGGHAGRKLVEDGWECGRQWAEKGWCSGYSGGLGALLASPDEGARRRAVEIVTRGLVARSGGRMDGARKMQVLVAQECAAAAGRMEYKEQSEALIVLIRHARWGAKGRVYLTAAASMWEEWLEGVAVRAVDGLVRATTGRSGWVEGRPSSQHAGCVAWPRLVLAIALLKELLGHAGAVEKAAGRGLVKGLAAAIAAAASDWDEGLGGTGDGDSATCGAGAVECLVHLASGTGAGTRKTDQIEAWEALTGVALASVAVGGSDELWEAMECGLLVVAHSQYAGAEDKGRGVGGRVRTVLERCGDEEVRTFCRLSRLMLRLEA